MAVMEKLAGEGMLVVEVTLVVLARLKAQEAPKEEEKMMEEIMMGHSVPLVYCQQVYVDQELYNSSTSLQN